VPIRALDRLGEPPPADVRRAELRARRGREDERIRAAPGLRRVRRELGELAPELDAPQRSSAAGCAVDRCHQLGAEQVSVRLDHSAPRAQDGEPLDDARTERIGRLSGIEPRGGDDLPHDERLRLLRRLGQRLAGGKRATDAGPERGLFGGHAGLNPADRVDGLLPRMAALDVLRRSFWSQSSGVSGSQSSRWSARAPKTGGGVAREAGSPLPLLAADASGGSARHQLPSFWNGTAPSLSSSA
jgi:hypothetical protein